ncbi:hypothetical protein LXA43DRAFT_203648 [Ganoderma leucocontextum]|nr:hypothetical protein LXA43DRAFT_203648 [Ganoderma leucocontextum]
MARLGPCAGRRESCMTIVTCWGEEQESTCALHVHRTPGISTRRPQDIEIACFTCQRGPDTGEAAYYGRACNWKYHEDALFLTPSVRCQNGLGRTTFDLARTDAYKNVITYSSGPSPRNTTPPALTGSFNPASAVRHDRLCSQLFPRRPCGTTYRKSKRPRTRSCHKSRLLLHPCETALRYIVNARGRKVCAGGTCPRPPAVVVSFTVPGLASLETERQHVHHV